MSTDHDGWTLQPPAAGRSDAEWINEYGCTAGSLIEFNPRVLHYLYSSYLQKLFITHLSMADADWWMGILFEERFIQRARNTILMDG